MGLTRGCFALYLTRFKRDRVYTHPHNPNLARENIMTGLKTPWATAGLLFILLAQPASATRLSVDDSNPNTRGWMQGFPPPPEKRLRAVDGSFFEFPALRYSVAHMREFMPTVEVSRGLGAPAPLNYRLIRLSTSCASPWGSEQPITLPTP
ncbi:hypothetical protein MBH78_15660 [Oceanimonas sp. NS1]|nr:hypothetical protein [Oceanimonas sp. NS1]